MSLIILIGAVATIALGILTMGGQRMQRAVIANLFGIVFSAGAALAVGLLNAVSGWVWSSWALPWMLGSSFLALMDMGYRCMGIRSQHARPVDQANEPSGALQNHWLTPSRGASLIIFPAWIVAGLLAVVFAVLSVRDLLWQAP